MLREEQMTWCPYPQSLLSTLPAYCRAGQAVWRSTCPLICYEVVEYHLPGRVMRQFGLLQVIPAEFDTDAQLHQLTRRGRGEVNWMQYHERYVEEWARRHEAIVQGHASSARLRYDDPYMDWYRHITRSHIAPPSHVPPVGSQPVAADMSILMDTIVRTHRLAITAVDDEDQSGYVQALHDIIAQTAPVIATIGHEERLRAPIPTTQPGSSSQAGPSGHSRVRPTGRRSQRHQTIYGPEAPADTSYPHVHDSDIPSSSTHMGFQTPPPATQACASLSADMDDFWSGILHIEPFSTSPAPISPSVPFDTGMSVTAPQAPLRAYTRRPRAQRPGTSSSTAVPMVLTTCSTDEPDIDDAPATHVHDAPMGEPHAQELPTTSAADEPLHPDRPRRIRRRTRCGTE